MKNIILALILIPLWGVGQTDSIKNPILQIRCGVVKPKITVHKDPPKKRVLKFRCEIPPHYVTRQSMNSNHVKPITWHYKAVRVDPYHIEIHITADIFRGWNIYAANRRDKCDLSPLVVFKKSRALPLGNLDVIEGIREDRPTCEVPAYRTFVAFVQVFKLKETVSDTIRGTIEYASLPPLGALDETIIEDIEEFSIPVKAEYPQSPEKYTSRSEPIAIKDPKWPNKDKFKVKKTTYCDLVSYEPHSLLKVCYHYPKGKVRKAWWALRHPFGRKYIKRHIVTSTMHH
jgi:hypothetical protein